MLNFTLVKESHNRLAIDYERNRWHNVHLKYMVRPPVAPLLSERKWGRAEASVWAFTGDTTTSPATRHGNHRDPGRVAGWIWGWGFATPAVKNMGETLDGSREFFPLIQVRSLSNTPEEWQWPGHLCWTYACEDKRQSSAHTHTHTHRFGVLILSAWRSTVCQRRGKNRQRETEGERIHIHQRRSGYSAKLFHLNREHPNLATVGLMDRQTERMGQVRFSFFFRFLLHVLMEERFHCTNISIFLHPFNPKA